MKFMNKATKVVALLAALALLAGISGAYSLHASAAGAVTYAVKYVPDRREWRFQANTSQFDDNAYHQEISILPIFLKSGDLVVVYNDSDSVPALNLGTTALSNLTVTRMKSFVVIYSGNITDCYLLAGASCSINANIANAYVYNDVLCNFNKDVNELTVYEGDQEKATLGSVGTVGHLFVSSLSTGQAISSLYNFRAGAFSMNKGVLTSDAANYTVTPSVATKTITAKNFDYVRYANDNPDLKAAFGYDAAALYKHYTTLGIQEKRLAYATTARVDMSDFDYTRYANDYADLKAAFGYNAAALYNHYINYGLQENRGNYSLSDGTYSRFDYIRYANDYKDLKTAFGYDAAALYNHYITFGLKENRGNYYK